MKTNLFSPRLLFWTSIVFFATWGSKLDGPTVAGVTLFPIRLIVLVSIAIFILNIIWSQRGPIRLNKLTCKVVILFLIGLVTSIWSPFRSSTATAIIVYLTSFVVAIIFRNSVIKQDGTKIIGSAIYINVLIMCIVAMYESITGHFLNLTYVDYIRSYNIFGLRKPIAAFYNTNNLTVYLLLSLPAVFLASENWKYKNLLKTIAFIFSAFVILLTGSRIGIVGLLLFVASYQYLNIFTYSKDKKNKALIILLILIVGFVFLSPIIVRMVLERDIADEARWNIWKTSLESAGKYYFLGSSPGTCTLLNGLIGPAHNFFLEILCEFGFIGLVICLLIFKDLIPVKRALYSNGSLKYNLIFVVLFLISSICSSSMQNYYFLWLYIGVFSGHLSIQTKQSKS